MLAGEAGVGKSMFSYHLALSVALGLPLLGRFPTERTKVLYVDEENSLSDLKRYIQWLWRGLGRPGLPDVAPWFQHLNFKLGSPGWLEFLRRIAKEQQPGLIVVDTATSALAIKDENDNGEASSAVGCLRRVQKECEDTPAVLVLKHAKTGDEGLMVRGAKAWVGSTDGLLYLTNPKGRPPKDGWGPKVLRPGKSRAFGLRERVVFEPIQVGEERKGWILRVKEDSGAPGDPAR